MYEDSVMYEENMGKVRCISRKKRCFFWLMNCNSVLSMTPHCLSTQKHTVRQTHVSEYMVLYINTLTLKILTISMMRKKICSKKYFRFLRFFFSHIEEWPLEFHCCIAKILTNIIIYIRYERNK